MAKKPHKEIELESDAWQRFERAASVVAKSPPQPKSKSTKNLKKAKRRAKRPAD